MAGNRETPTRPWDGAGLDDRGYDNVTRPVQAPPGPTPGARQPDGGTNDPRTIPVGAQRTPGMAEEFDPMRDPVVGWLVVVSGVGKGTHRPLGYGQNTVGRGEDARVKLIYGAAFKLLEGATQIIDTTIEANIFDTSVGRSHFIITYDERSRAFYVQNSPDSINLTYIKGDNQPLMQPKELKPFDRIQAGKSEFMFVPLCHRGVDDGPGFDWKDT